jgi:polar amino acid transport system substrate-binding protein
MRSTLSVTGDVILVLALAVMFLIAPARAESTLETMLKRGTFLAGITSDSPPSGFLDAQGHQLGYCADVARYLSRRLDVKLQFVPVTATSRIPLLQTGRIDAEVAVTTPQKVRNEVVDFTYSYIWDDAVLLVRVGDSTKIDDYVNAKKIIGSTQGNGFIDRWKQMSPNAQFKLFPDEPSTVIALKKGDIDTYLANELAAVRYVKSGGLTMSAPWTNSPDAIMIRENDSKWQKWLNWALQRMWVEGTLQKLYVKWYGLEPPFHIGDYGQIQPRVMEIGKENDPWHELPAGFLDKLMGDQSYTLDE